MTSTYISSGNIVRDPQDFGSTRSMILRWERVWMILVPLLILVLTNPANQDKIATTLQESEWEISSSTQELLNYCQTYGISKWRSTNYGLLALQKQFDRLEIFALNSRFECYYNDPQIGPICSELGKFRCLHYLCKCIINRLILVLVFLSQHPP